MEKLTLRQFADVTKALVEAGLSKEEGEYTVNLNEMPDRFRDEGVYFSLKGTKKIEKEIEEDDEEETDVACSFRSEGEIEMDMNHRYERYVEEMDKGKNQTEILKEIAVEIAEDILHCDEEPDDMLGEFDELKNCMLCRNAAKAALAVAATAAGVAAVRKLAKKN